MKTKHILLALTTLLLTACVSKDQPAKIERNFNTELRSIDAENMRVFIFDSIFDTTSFTLTSTDKLVTKEVNADANVRPSFNSSDDARTVENVNLFNVRVQDFESGQVIKDIDLVPILVELEDYVLASTYVSVLEEDNREYLELRMYKKFSLSPSHYTAQTKKQDFSLLSVFFLQVDIETEQFRLTSYNASNQSERSRLSSIIPEIYDDNENEIEFYDVQSAFGSKSLRITIPAHKLPSNNKKLYDALPELKDLSVLAKRDYPSAITKEGNFNGAAIVFYIYNYDNEAEILSYFNEDE